jgi:hypothetical protein
MIVIVEFCVVLIVFFCVCCSSRSRSCFVVLVRVFNLQCNAHIDSEKTNQTIPLLYVRVHVHMYACVCMCMYDRLRVRAYTAS